MGKIITAIISFLVRLKSNPLAASIATAVVDAISSIPPEVPRRVFSLVVEASQRDEENRAKFIWVYNKLRVEFPDVGENMIRTLIESSLLNVKKGQ
jgi:hypothetical protein